MRRLCEVAEIALDTVAAKTSVVYDLLYLVNVLVSPVQVHTELPLRCKTFELLSNHHHLAVGLLFFKQICS